MFAGFAKRCSRSLLKERQGFTLIEVLVVIAVLALLILVAAPSFLGQSDKAYDSEANQTAANVYRSSHYNWNVGSSDVASFPSVANVITELSKDLPGYTFHDYQNGVAPSTGPQDVSVDVSGLRAIYCVKSKSLKVFCQRDNGTANSSNYAGGLVSQAQVGINEGDAREAVGWQFLPRGTNPDPSDNGIIDFWAGAPNPPSGTQSLRMISVNGKNVTAVAPMPPGVPNQPPLSTLNKLSYDSYISSRPTSGKNIDVKIALYGAVRQDGNPSGFTTLVFEPVYNPTQGAEVVGQWQHWNAYTGKFWSTARLGPLGKCTTAVPCTMAEVLATSPSAWVYQVRFEIGQNSGVGWGGFSGSGDNFSLGFTTGSATADLGN